MIFIGAIFLTRWNEGAYVSSQETLQAAYSQVHEYPCSNTTSIPVDGVSLVFLQGCPLDGMPEWSSGSFVFLQRPRGVWFETSMEMYQWSEKSHSRTTKDSVGGGKTTVKWWSHERGWHSELRSSPTHCDQASGPDSICDRSTICDGPFVGNSLDSNRPHCNPNRLPNAPTSGKQYTLARTIRTGPVFPNNDQLAMVTSRRAVLPDAESLGSETATLPITALIPSNSRLEGGAVTSTPLDSPVRVGDVRVRWYTSTAQKASLLAAVDVDATMVPWYSGVTKRVAGAQDHINELQEGDVPLEVFFATLQSHLETRVWLLRVVSLVLFVVGTWLVLSPLSVMPDIIPFLGPIVGDVVGCVLGVMACLWGGFTFLLVTAICWISFRPMVGIPLLLSALALAYAAIRLRRRAAEKSAGQQLPREATPMMCETSPNSSGTATPSAVAIPMTGMQTAQPFYPQQVYQAQPYPTQHSCPYPAHPACSYPAHPACPYPAQPSCHCEAYASAYPSMPMQHPGATSVPMGTPVCGNEMAKV